MCGITGFIDYTKRSDAGILRGMTDTMVHRGPDDSGYFFEETDQATVGLGHRRLSILDLSPKGHQPMGFHSRTVVFNGEIYNFREIADELTTAGYTFDSDSDTEVILKAYDRWGPGCVEKFIGMFAFVLYDQNTRELFIFRDRAGVKPVYYYEKDGLFMFSSELKGMMKHPYFQKELDESSLALFLQYNYIPTPHCIFRNTQKLEPGHYLKVVLKTRNQEKIKYWDVADCYNQPKLDISYEEAVIETERLLQSAFSYRMVSDVPVGLFLSGGYDSTAVAAILQSQSSEKLKTFTIGYAESEFNEAPEAKKVAAFLGTEHTEKYVTAQDAGDILEKLPFIYDEPFSDNSVVPTYLVSQLARTQVTVALSGDGGDEIFAGYDKFTQSIKYTSYPHLAQKLLAAMLSRVNPSRIPVLRSRYNIDTRFLKLIEIWKNRSPLVAMKVIAQYNTLGQVRSYLNMDFADKLTYFDMGSELDSSNDALNKMLAVDYKTFLLDNNLTKIDRAAMAVSLEGREPFLDQRVIEFVSRLPSDYKIRNGQKKSLLKSIVHKYVPEDIMNRPKMPFIAPLKVWFKKELKDYYLEYMDGERLRKEGIFNPDVVSLRDAYLSGQNINHQKIWNILVFQMWKEKWM